MIMNEPSFAEAATRAVADTNAVLVDVRRDDEWAASHATSALHWELARLEKGELPDIPKDAAVYVYCAAGGRAGAAAAILKEHGWTNVTNIGGLKDWEAAGGALEQ